MKFILGTKEEMGQFFTEDGRVHPVTAVSATPSIVVDLKTKNRDGYEAVQIGFGSQKKERITKPRLGQMKNLGPFRVLKEFRVPAKELSDMKVGDSISVSSFTAG